MDNSYCLTAAASHLVIWDDSEKALHKKTCIKTGQGMKEGTENLPIYSFLVSLFHWSKFALQEIPRSVTVTSQAQKWQEESGDSGIWLISITYQSWP